MAKLTDPSNEASSEDCLIRMALHLTNWATELIEQVGNDVVEAYEPSHVLSRARLLGHLDELQDNFRRGIGLLEISDCRNRVFLRWLNNAQNFSRVLTKLVKRCRLVRETEGFLQLAQAITYSALDNCNKMEKMLAVSVNESNLDEHETLVWQLPSWCSEEVFDEAT
jgi:hypothetical protein